MIDDDDDDGGLFSSQIFVFVLLGKKSQSDTRYKRPKAKSS